VKIVFLDTETTGLDAAQHDVWEIAAILRQDGADTEHHWMLKPDLSNADPDALRINGFWARTVGVTYEEDKAVAESVTMLLADAVVIGSNPGFDKEFLAPFLRGEGFCWAAHYRPLDVVTLAAGFLRGLDEAHKEPSTFTPRVSAHEVSRAVGVDPDDYDRHTALGDARWVRDLYDAVTGGPR